MEKKDEEEAPKRGKKREEKRGSRGKEALLQVAKGAEQDNWVGSV